MSIIQLLLFAIILAVSIGNVGSVLAPGYEDEMWCPPTDCQIWANPYTGTGFAGARSSFEFCYNPATNATTSAMWTGFLTSVTPPAGWVEEPAECTLQEYSQCNIDSDCTLDISPSPSCNCYVKSSFHPSYWTFHPVDPCDGLAPSDCNSDGCHGDECHEYNAKCVDGACLLERIGTLCGDYGITTCNLNGPDYSCHDACGDIISLPCQTNCHGTGNDNSVLSCTINRGNETVFQCFATSRGRFLRGTSA